MILSVQRQYNTSLNFNFFFFFLLMLLGHLVVPYVFEIMQQSQTYFKYFQIIILIIGQLLFTE